MLNIIEIQMVQHGKELYITDHIIYLVEVIFDCGVCSARCMSNIDIMKDKVTNLTHKLVIFSSTVTFFHRIRCK